MFLYTSYVSVELLYIKTSNSNNKTPVTSHPVAPEAQTPDHASRPMQPLQSPFYHLLLTHNAPETPTSCPP